MWTKLSCLLYFLDLCISDDFLILLLLLFSLAAIPLANEQVNRLVANFCPLCQQKEKVYVQNMFFVFTCTCLYYVRGRTFFFYLSKYFYPFFFLFLLSFFYLFYSEQFGNHSNHGIFESCKPHLFSVFLVMCSIELVNEV